jgi:hypothetical protein
LLRVRLYLHVQKGRWSGNSFGNISEALFLFVGVFMGQPESVTAFRPAVSADDWKTIMEAIKAYSHNSDYRSLLERLERQAVLNGIIKPIGRLS